MNTLPERISQRIDALWGTEDCRNYLLELLTYKVDNERPEPRKGFPLHILLELLKKLEEHDKYFPGLLPKDTTEVTGKVVFMSPIK